jgi:hypothetical protein
MDARRGSYKTIDQIDNAEGEKVTTNRVKDAISQEKVRVMIDYSKPDYPPPEKLTCYGISQRETFTAYKIEKNEDFYRWFQNLTKDLGIPNSTSNEYEFWEISTDYFITHGPNEDIIVVQGDDKILLFFKERPDPDTILEYIDMDESKSDQTW